MYKNTSVSKNIKLYKKLHLNVFKNIKPITDSVAVFSIQKMATLDPAAANFT